MPRYSRYDDDDYWYDKWCEYREQQEDEEEAAAWRAEVDENCECVYAEGDEYYRYYSCDWVQPLTKCQWHMAGEVAAAEARATEIAVAQEQADLAAAAAAESARVQAAEFAALKERVGIETPDIYIQPSDTLPIVVPEGPWRAQILYVRERLRILDGRGLGEEIRMKLIGDIFAYLAEPENVGLVHGNAKFRATVLSKMAEFRADARAASITGVMDNLETVIAVSAV